MQFISKFFRRYTTTTTARATTATMSTAKEQVEEYVNDNKIVVFSKSWCPYCRKAKETISDLKVEFKVIELDKEENGDDIQVALKNKTGQSTVPSIFIGQSHIGGNSDLQAIPRKKLAQMVDAKL